MSGLITFFKDFFPNVHNIDYGRSLEEITEDECAGSGQQEDDNFSGEHTPQPWTFREWRDFSKDSLKVYFQRRLGSADDEDQNDDGQPQGAAYYDDDNEDKDDDEEESSQDEEDESQWNTQQQEQAQVAPSTASSPTKKQQQQRQQQRRIPSLKQAIHSVQTLEFLDMYTSELTLNLCKIQNCWRLRDTKRGQQWTRKHTCPVYPGRMPRIPFAWKEEDGPVASTFKQVVSVEVEQLVLSGGNIGVGSASTANKQRRRCRRRRIRIFFYNTYAKRVWEWMQEQSSKNGGNSFCLSLAKVPAVCIFPYALDPQNWLDQDELMEYCVCIGDLSSLKYNDASTTPLRLDAPAMEIRLARTTPEHPSELILSRDVLNAASVAATADESSKQFALTQAWQDYQKTQQPPPQQQQLERPSHETTTRAAGIEEISSTLAEASEVAAEELPRPQQAQPPRPAMPPTPQVQPRQPPLSPEPMTFEGPAKKRQKKSAKISSTFVYVPLADLRDVHHSLPKTATVCVYAAVLGFTSPSQTKQGDWMMTASLVDASCTTPVTLVMFCKSKERLPQVMKMGDVLRMHRVSLQEWKGDVQILGKRPSSYVVIRKKQQQPVDNTTTTNENSNGWSVVPTATNYYVFNDEDEQRCQVLWHWAQDFIVAQPTINAEHCFTLADMVGLTDEAGEDKVRDRDLTVMVTARIPYPTQERTGITPCGFLRVWDGTGMPPSDPLVLQTMPARQTQEKGDPPPEALTKIASTIQKLHASGRSRNLETPKALCGKVANVLIWEESHWKLIADHASVGSFIRLRNVDVRKWKTNEFRCKSIYMIYT
jgi:hypothetical protein